MPERTVALAFELLSAQDVPGRALTFQIGDFSIESASPFAAAHRMALAQLLAQFNTSDPSVRWGLIAIAAALLLYVMVLRPMSRKRDPLRRSPLPSGLAQHRAVERDMTQLLVDLSDMARQMTAQLDTRSTKLELLIKEADEKLAALKAAVDNGAAPSEPPKRSISFTHSDPSPSPEPTPDDSRHERVYAMADEGRDVRDIARELERPTGEIELILALRSKN